MGILGGLRKQPAPAEGDNDVPTSSPQNEKSSSRKWNLGILSDPLTDEVPGMLRVLLQLRSAS